MYGNAATNSYIEDHYPGYKFNQDDVDIASFTVPKGFRPHKKWSPSNSLVGNTAPDWTLYTADGKKMSLSQMKGKVILLDFYFIGCYGCMLSLTPLNNLYEKYKNQNFIIASVTERNSEKAVLTFDKQYGIKYPSLVKAADVVKLYEVSGFPTFYFIDKEGKIAKVKDGYSDDFEATTASTIDSLLNK